MNRNCKKKNNKKIFYKCKLELINKILDYIWYIRLKITYFLRYLLVFYYKGIWN